MFWIFSKVSTMKSESGNSADMVLPLAFPHHTTRKTSSGFKLDDRNVALSLTVISGCISSRN
jgi:hypothetical protein